MNTYFRQGLTRLTRPASPFSRQHSWDSTASTLLPSDDNDDNVTTVDEPPPDNSKDSFRHYHYAGIPEATPAIINLPSARKVAIDRQQQPTTTNLRRRHPAARTKPPVIVRCEACDFNPDPGPDQQKKLARHNLTRKHRQKITGRSPCSISLKEIPEDEGEDAEKTEEEEERFQCTFSFEDGSVCEKSFNRKDNLQQHVKRKHESDGGAEMRHRAVKRRRVDRT
ncbi:hypothetical protein B0H66DRAFT_549782 [Apodospora peruviana]|uniref:C2H2-type domain-containing protein n=1 Tax=Apodospora peruviana TaxID=516989 RepID=A0AAE0IIV8_9PEZI|nr:hypothetical protein B0H66DRAFT_549782 [Apodospora peruviana]